MEKYFPELSADFARLLAALAGRKIAVVGHARPDGDCIGSQVALARMLTARGFDTICVNADPVPRRGCNLPRIFARSGIFDRDVSLCEWPEDYGP